MPGSAGAFSATKMKRPVWSKFYDPGERLEFADLLPAADAIGRFVGGLFESTVGGTPDIPVAGPTVATVGHDAS